MMGPIRRLPVNMQELLAVLERVKAFLSEEDHKILRGAIETLGLLTRMLENRKTTIRRLRQMLFGASTEKTRNVLKTNAVGAADKAGDGGGADPFDYLTELQRHSGDLADNPAAWMPWNYKHTLQAVRPPPARAA